MNGKRKYSLTWAVLVLSAAMVFAGKIDGAGWITIASMATLPPSSGRR